MMAYLVPDYTTSHAMSLHTIYNQYPVIQVKLLLPIPCHLGFCREGTDDSECSE